MIVGSEYLNFFRVIKILKIFSGFFKMKSNEGKKMRKKSLIYAFFICLKDNSVGVKRLMEVRGAK